MTQPVDGGTMKEMKEQMTTLTSKVEALQQKRASEARQQG